MRRPGHLNEVSIDRVHQQKIAGNNFQGRSEALRNWSQPGTRGAGGLRQELKEARSHLVVLRRPEREEIESDGFKHSGGGR